MTRLLSPEEARRIARAHASKYVRSVERTKGRRFTAPEHEQVFEAVEEELFTLGCRLLDPRGDDQ